MNANNDYFKDLMEAFFAKHGHEGLSSASLILFWLNTPKSISQDELTNKTCTIKVLKQKLALLIENYSSAPDRWLLDYLGKKENLSHVSMLEFFHDCMTSDNESLRNLFNECGISSELLQTLIKPNKASAQLEFIQEKAAQSPKHLLSYGRDLIACAHHGEFEGLVKRDHYFSELLGVLAKKRKGNVIITGPAGAGKTALVECLAKALANGELETVFPHMKLFEIRLSKMLAGTQYRGMFEERLEEMITEAEKLNPVIVFIDEIHLLWGAGRTSESVMDAANILKPHLARRHFKLIGATTSQEYRQYILRDAALARRFEEIKLPEPDEALTQAMVGQQLKVLAEAHGVEFEDGCDYEAIILTDRYMQNRKQPDKAINLLDTVAGKISLQCRKTVTVNDLRQNFSPANQEQINSSIPFVVQGLELEQKLNQQIFGQTAVISAVARSLAMRRFMDQTKISKPASFLFAGNSGVGKTSFAANIATYYFGHAKQCLHLNLGEYNTPLSVSQILGAPPLARVQESGLLTQFLDTYSNGVLLFDEIEKAHPDILNMLLGLLDTGQVKTGAGDSLVATDCVLIATTNTLCPAELERKPVGFSCASMAPNPIELLSKHFRIEFLNRFDELLIFKDLDGETIQRIIKKELLSFEPLVTKIMKEKGWQEDRLLHHIYKEMGAEKGARAVKRVTRKAIEELMMEFC